MSLVCGAEVFDVCSGLRAFSRAHAEELVVSSSYTYTIETLVQAARLKRAIETIEINVNAPLRESRLIRNHREYVVKVAGKAIQSRLTPLHKSRPTLRTTTNARQPARRLKVPSAQLAS
jgi:hypothetical protein